MVSFLVDLSRLDWSGSALKGGAFGVTRPRRIGWSLPLVELVLLRARLQKASLLILRVEVLGRPPVKGGSFSFLYRSHLGDSFLIRSLYSGIRIGIGVKATARRVAVDPGRILLCCEALLLLFLA